jgi:multidrug efflux system outer membrane protein
VTRRGICDVCRDTVGKPSEAEGELIALRLASVTNLVTLYKALGGGWNEASVAAGAGG